MLHESARPKEWADFVGNEKAVARVRAIIADKSRTGAPIALWIDGASGIGKTTLAKIIATDLGAADAMDCFELDGDSCDKAAVHDVASRLNLCAWNGHYRAVIVNEAHAMSKGAVQAWLTLLERMPKKTAAIFTTTEGRGADMFGTFDGPLKSRAIPISLTSQGLCPAFAKRAFDIGRERGYIADDCPEKTVLNAVKAEKNNLRAVLSRVEGFEFS